MSTLPVYNAPVGNGLSWLAFSINVILSLSQLPLMRAMIADVDPVSLAKYSIYPSLLQAVTCGMWCGYGAFSLSEGTGTTLIANNAIGLTLSFIYVSVFVAKRPAARDKALAGGLWLACVGAAVIIYASIYSRSAAAFPGRDTLAGALSDAGFSVYLLAHRGDADAIAPSPGATPWFDDVVGRDLPAAIERVVAHARYARALFVGHGLGGQAGLQAMMKQLEGGGGGKGGAPDMSQLMKMMGGGGGKR